MSTDRLDIQNIIANAAQPGTVRHEVLGIAQRFKSNWYEFGEKLTRVANEELYQEWGYSSFEEYCAVEVKIKKNTAIKLTNAWFFLSREEPQLMANGENADIPDLESVQVLQKAKAEGLDPDQYQQLRDNALLKKQAKATLSKQLQNMRKAAGATPETASPPEQISLARIERVLTQKQAPEHILLALQEIKDFLQQEQLAGVAANT